MGAIAITTGFERCAVRVGLPERGVGGAGGDADSGQ